MRSHLDHGGDTIIEVIIAMVVISFVLAAAFTTTNRSLKEMQQAQEHTKALKVAESQAEYLRSVSNESTHAIYNYTNYFCMVDGTIDGIKDATSPVVANSTPFATLNSSGDNYTYTSDCQITDGGLTFNEAIERTALVAPGYVFKIHIRWDSVQGQGHDEVTIFDKLNK